MNDAYVREQTRKTEQLIAVEPTTLTLRRKAPATTTAAGGSKQGDEWVDQPPITVFYGAKTRDDMPLQDGQGEHIIQYYTVVGEPGTDIQNGDMFTIYGIDHLVTYVHRNLPYEVKADVESYHGGR